MAVVAKSKTRENTAGCKFERDLQALIDEGASLDQKLMALEQTYNLGAGFTDAEIVEAGKHCTALASILTSAQKKTRR